MRIALMTETFLPDVNGVVTTLCRLLEHVQSHGHEAMLFAPHDAPSSYAGAQIVPLQSMPLPVYAGLKCTPPQWGVSAHLHRFKPDLLHLAGPMLLGPTGRYVAHRLRLPLISAYHTDFPAYSAHYGMGWLKSATYRYMRWIHNSCALTLCPSQATLHDLRVHGFRRLRLWRRGIDSTRFHPRYRSEAWRSSIGLRDDETLLIYVGRLAIEKRIDLIADALNDMDGVRLVFVGDGPARPLLERQCAGKPVHFTGFLRGEALATAYASADICLFPSDTETFGQVIQEAMASALPVIAARAGGALDLVADGVTGVMFTPGAVNELRAQIQRLVANPEQRVMLGQAGRSATEGRSWARVCDELLGHYERIQRRSTRALVGPTIIPVRR